MKHKVEPNFNQALTDYKKYIIVRYILSNADMTGPSLDAPLHY